MMDELSELQKMVAALNEWLNALALLDDALIRLFDFTRDPVLSESDGYNLWCSENFASLSSLRRKVMQKLQLLIEEGISL
jgi:hypothetical protein